MLNEKTWRYYTLQAWLYVKPAPKKANWKIIKYAMVSKQYNIFYRGVVLQKVATLWSDGIYVTASNC